jgi:hypothetical protein
MLSGAATAAGKATAVAAAAIDNAVRDFLIMGISLNGMTVLLTWFGPGGVTGKKPPVAKRHRTDHRY